MVLTVTMMIIVDDLVHFISSPVATKLHPITLLLSSGRYAAGAVRDQDRSWTRVIEG